MTWVKLDDTWTERPEVLAAGPLAGWLHVCALSYCARQLTDGMVPRRQLRRLADLDDPESGAQRLVECGLWAENDGGWEIVDYLVDQPSAEKVRRERKLKAERQARWLEKKRQQRKDNDASVDASHDGSTDEPVDGSEDAAPPRPAPKEGGGGAPGRRRPRRRPPPKCEDDVVNGMGIRGVGERASRICGKCEQRHPAVAEELPVAESEEQFWNLVDRRVDGLKEASGL